MEELHTNFGDALTLDESEPQLHLKLAGSLRNKLMRKLNEHSLLTKEAVRMKTMEENNQIISTLDGLPILVEDDDELILNQDTRKFLKGIDYIKRKLGTFDAKKINIAIWFKQFECLAEMLGWSKKQRVDALAYLLGPALDRLVHENEPEYEIIKGDTIILVNGLLLQGHLDMGDHLTFKVMAIFRKKKFTNPEIRYWLECIASPQYLKESCSEIGSYPDGDKMVSLIEMCFK